MNRNLTRAAALGLVAALTLPGCGPKVETATAELRPLTEWVYASGTTEPAGAYTVQAPVAARVLQVAVREGDTVAPGQVLLVLEADQVAVQEADAQERLARALARQANGAQRAELQTAIANARAIYRQDSADSARQQALLAGQATTAFAAEQARLKAQVSAENLKMALQRLAALEENLDAERQAAARAVQLLGARGRDYRVVATAPGRVYARNIEPGELAQPSRSLLTLGALDSWELRLYIDEADVNRVRPGQECLVRLDNFPPDSLFAARVQRVYPQLDTRRNGVRVDARWAGTPPSPQYAGVGAEANIQIQTRAQALVIPRACLLPGDSVWVQHQGEWQTQPVRVGLRNLEFVEITSGLSPGQQVRVP